MDKLLDYLYHDTMKRYWAGSPAQAKAIEDLEAAEGRDWDDIYDAARLFANEKSFAAFLAAFHLGSALERALWQKRGAGL